MAKDKDTTADPASDHLEKATDVDGDTAGGDEVQEKFDEIQDRGFLALDEEDAERNVRENESLSLPNPQPLDEG
jgi:hypothetical protein